MKYDQTPGFFIKKVKTERSANSDISDKEIDKEGDTREDKSEARADVLKEEAMGRTSTWAQEQLKLLDQPDGSGAGEQKLDNVHEQTTKQAEQTAQHQIDQQHINPDAKSNIQLQQEFAGGRQLSVDKRLLTRDSWEGKKQQQMKKNVAEAPDQIMWEPPVPIQPQKSSSQTALPDKLPSKEGNISVPERACSEEPKSSFDTPPKLAELWSPRKTKFASMSPRRGSRNNILEQPQQQQTQTPIQQQQQAQTPIQQQQAQTPIQQQQQPSQTPIQQQQQQQQAQTPIQQQQPQVQSTPQPQRQTHPQEKQHLQKQHPEQQQQKQTPKKQQQQKLPLQRLNFAPKVSDVEERSSGSTSPESTSPEAVRWWYGIVVSCYWTWKGIFQVEDLTKDFPTMTEELWYHALTFLDKYRTDVLTYDVDQLYEFADKTGILERHKQLLAIPYHENQVDMKIMYYELIKMLLDFERSNHPETFDATKTVGKIEGYQELTNKLQRYMNQRFLADIGENKDQISIINQMFGGDVTSINITEKFEALEQTNITLLQEIKLMKEQDTSMLQKIKDLEEKIEKNEQKTGFVEDQFSVFETAQTATNMSVDEQLKTLTDKSNLLQVKVDNHEEVTVVLFNNNAKQDERLAALENQGLSLDNKVTSLESADVFLQEATRQLTERSANVETENRRIEDQLNHLINQQQEEIDDKLKVQIADLLKDVVEINQDKNKIYERLNEVEEHDVAHEDRLDELEKAGLEATKKLALEIDEKMKGYDETSTDRLKKAEADIKTNADNIASMDKEAKHVTEQISNIITTNITINETIHEMSKKTEDDLNALQNKVKSLEEGSKNTVEKLVSMEEHQYVQNEKVMYVQTLNERVNKIDEERQESAEQVKRDLDGLVEKNTKAIDDLKKEYEQNMNNVMTANVTINENFNGIHIKTEETWQALEDLKNKQNVDISNVNNNLDIEKKRIDNIIEEFKEISDDIDNNKSDIKKNSDRLNELDNVNSNLSSKVDDIADGNTNRDDQIRNMEVRISSNSTRIDSLEVENQATLIKSNTMNEHLEVLDKTVEDLAAKQNEADVKLQGVSTLTNKIELDVKNYEQEMDKKSSNDINDIRVQLEGLKSDVNANDKKFDEVDNGNQATVEKILAFQQDIDGKFKGLSENDNLLFAKIDGLEHDNIQKNERIQNIQDNYQNNIEKLVQIEEQTHLQAEKVHYVEMLSDRVNQIDDQRQKTEAKVKDEVDESFIKNSKAIEEMKKQFEGMISEIEKHREIEQESLKSESDSLSLLINDLQSEGNMQKGKIQNLMEDKLKLEDELEEAKKVSKNFQNTGDNLKDSLEKYQSMLEGKLKEVGDETKDNTKRIMELEPETKAITAKILDLQNKNEEKFRIIKDELANENKDLFGTLKNEVDDIMKLNDEKANEIDSHVDNLRELNKKLIDQVKEQMHEQGEHQDIIADEIKRANESQISDVKDDFEKRITLLFTKTEENQDAIEKANEVIVEMNEQANKIIANVDDHREEIDELKKNIDLQRELVVTKITEQKDTLESFFKTLETKVETIETIQIQEASKMELIYQQTEAQEKLAQQMEQKIKQVERETEEHSNLITMVEKTSNEKRELLGKEIKDHAKSNVENIKAVRSEMEKGKDDLWTLIVEIYSTFRGYTVVLKSEGAVRNHQADTLGVYRMVDSYNDRPVYKQDGGENYIYYSAASSSWLVGTVVGHQYGWLRNNKESAKDRRWIPDLRTGWEYKPLVRTNANLEANSWATDDGTLRIESLRDVEKVNELIRDIKNSKEID